MAVTALTLLALCSCSSSEQTSLPADNSAKDTKTSTTTVSTSTTSATGSSGAVTADATTSTSTPSVQPTGNSDQEIIDRYVGYWQARFDVNSGVPNPDDPRLAEFATGRQLEQVRNEARANRDGGLSFRAAAKPANFQRVAVVAVDGDHAVVQECVVADGVVFNRDTGVVVDDSVSTYNARGELDRVDGVWRVSAVTMVQKWPGVAGCALGS